MNKSLEWIEGEEAFAAKIKQNPYNPIGTEEEKERRGLRIMDK